MIDNPNYKDKSNFYNLGTIGGVAIELYQLNAGTIFDNILITDSLKEADEQKNELFEQLKDAQVQKEDL